LSVAVFDTEADHLSEASAGLCQQDQNAAEVVQTLDIDSREQGPVMIDRERLTRGFATGTLGILNGPGPHVGQRGTTGEPEFVFPYRASEGSAERGHIPAYCSGRYAPARGGMVPVYQVGDKFANVLAAVVA
jgi:hypothetical protein